MQDIKAATQPSHSRRQKHIFIKELAYGRHTIFAVERPKWCIHQITEHSPGWQSQRNDEGGAAAYVPRRKDDDERSRKQSLDQ
jgi:hypothetical protein